MGLKSLRNGNRRDGRTFQTEGPVALLAVAMDMEVIVLVVMMAVA